MAETTGRQVLFSILILGAVITAAFGLIAMSLPNDDTGFSGHNSTFNKFETMRTDAETTSSIMENTEPNLGLLGILDGLIQSSWGAIMQMWSSLGILTTLLSSLSSTFGVPVWFTGLLTAIVLLTLTFAIIAAIFKWHI